MFRALWQYMFDVYWMKETLYCHVVDPSLSMSSSVTPWQSMLGFPVLHDFMEFVQIHVHWPVMLSNHHILCSSSPFAFNLSQHQGFFPVSRLFASGGQSFGATVSVLPVNIQGWFPLGLTGLITLQSKELSWVFSSTTVWKHRFFGAQPFLWSNSHICTWLLGKPYLFFFFFFDKVMSLFFNTLSRFFITFLSRNKCLLISWLQSQSSVILETKKIKSVTVLTFPLSICLEVMGPNATILGFWMLRLKPAFPSLLSLSSRDSLVPLCFLPLEWYQLLIWDYCFFSQKSWFQLVLHTAWHFTWCTLHRS